jgi:dephospho-CoA kinase
MNNKRLIIGLTGTNASGKGTIAEFLKSQGFSYYSLSDVIRNELKARKTEINRENLIEEGNKLRIKFGPSVLALRIIGQMEDSNTVIDSIRNVHEVKELRKLGNFILISVDAPVQTRFKRAKDRGRNESSSSLTEFEEMEKKELSQESEHQQIHRCMNMADIKIINDGTKEQMYDKITKIIKNY